MNDIQQEMPKFNCTKQVHALKIKTIENGDDESAVINFVDENFSPLIHTKEDQMHKPMPGEGWYYVVYRDGYTSFSPASEFEDGYGLILKDESNGDVVNAEFSETQDPKYLIIAGQLCNAFTKEPIPSNEPVFILRAKDIHAYPTLDFYEDKCTDEEHRSKVAGRMVEFDEFKSKNNDLMGEPDTLGDEDFQEYQETNSSEEGDSTAL